MTYENEITVIVLTYNPNRDELKRTLCSICAQVDCSYQLLIVDDHSSEDPTQMVGDIAMEIGLDAYEFIRNERNLKTVKSILGSLGRAKGQFVKLIGSGDELYDAKTLRTIVDFCRENNALCGFGDIEILGTGKRLAFPSNYSEYPPDGSTSRKALFEQQIIGSDWIPGCSQFYERAFLEKMLIKLSTYYGVEYCEDFSECIALLETDVFHLGSPIVKYSFGDGISTNGTTESRKRLYNDHSNFLEKIHADRPFGINMAMPFLVFRLKRFIALKTPFYRKLQKLFANNHIQDD